MERLTFGRDDAAERGCMCALLNGLLNDLEETTLAKTTISYLFLAISISFLVHLYPAREVVKFYLL